MNIALIGYGKMGKLIEQLAPGEVKLKLDEFNNAHFEGVTADNFRGIDVAIDFSIPAAAVENIERISALGVNLVVGTTGWFDRLDHVRNVIARHNTGLAWDFGTPVTLPATTERRANTVVAPAVIFWDGLRRASAVR